MSVREIMRARTIVCTVPDQRKAEAARMAILAKSVRNARPRSCASTRIAISISTARPPHDSG